jgi:hypothetical protein
VRGLFEDNDHVLQRKKELKGVYLPAHLNVDITNYSLKISENGSHMQ